MLLLISASLFLFLRKQNAQKQAFQESKKDTDITVIFTNKLVNYSLKNGKLDRLNEIGIKIPEDNNHDFSQFENKVLFSTGHVTSNKNQFRLGILDISNGHYTEKKRDTLPTTGLGYDKEHFYTMTSKVGSGTEIQQFNTSGEKVKSTRLKEEGLGIKILGNDDFTFMLSGVENTKYHESIDAKRLTIFDPEKLDIKADHILDSVDSDYMLGLTDMEIISNKIYFPNTCEHNKKTLADEVSSKLLVYNLDTKEQSEILLEENYPTGITKDSKEKNLIIGHEPNQLGKYVFSIYNLET
ncbi:MAG: hypothetical protein LBD38_03880, partial [Streptococcaceae bacterium]|nr:hypothetical protein [Streptococcaceae bacterium]